MRRDLRRELMRKLVQVFGICLVPLGRYGALFLLICAIAEMIHLSRPDGLPIFRTLRALGERDGRMDWGPLLLALGAAAVLLLFDEPWTWALCGLVFVGDSSAAIMGMLLQGPHIPLSRKKHLTGSISFLVCVWGVAYMAGLSPVHAGVIACVGTVVEAYAPAGLDNLILPLSGMITVLIVDGDAIVWIP